MKNKLKDHNTRVKHMAFDDACKLLLDINALLLKSDKRFQIAYTFGSEDQTMQF